MTLLGVWNGQDPWRIYKTGDPIRADGEGVTWRCTCPRGEPGETKEESRARGWPCKHIKSIWAHAEEGLYDPHVDWTVEGEAEGQRCKCRSAKPCPLRHGPPIQRPPEVLPLGAPLNKPCPCGSGRKFKKCEGVGPGRPDGPAHPLLQPLELATPAAATPPPCPVPPPVEELQRRSVAEHRAQIDEAQAEASRRLAEILERVRAKEEARRLRRWERERERLRATLPNLIEPKDITKAARRLAKLDEVLGPKEE